jgi:plasmid maintenance system antidote protein VapI
MPRMKLVPVDVGVLTNYMERHELFQSDLARMAGISASSMSQLLRDGVATQQTILMIERAINQSIPPRGVR